MSAEINRASWIAHSVGELALVSSQDPSIFATDHRHQLFIDGRFYLVSHNLHPVRTLFFHIVRVSRHADVDYFQRLL